MHNQSCVHYSTLVKKKIQYKMSLMFVCLLNPMLASSKQIGMLFCIFKQPSSEAQVMHREDPTLRRGDGKL